jgi:hypothetical protein
VSNKFNLPLSHKKRELALEEEANPMTRCILCKREVKNEAWASHASYCATRHDEELEAVSE